MAYCDYIINEIKHAIEWQTGPIEWDLHPEEGYMMSTKKSMNIVDFNGKSYKVTVEEV